MDLHEWLTFGNTTRTHQGAEGPPRELPSLPLFKLRSLFVRCERALWRHLLTTYKKENCTSRPRPIGTNTSTEATSSAEVTSILASTMRFEFTRAKPNELAVRHFWPIIRHVLRCRTTIFLMFGWPARLPVDVTLGIPYGGNTADAEETTEQRGTILRISLDLTRRNWCEAKQAAKKQKITAVPRVSSWSTSSDM